MAHVEAAMTFGQAAFRSQVTGAVVATGPFHDVTLLPGGLDADLEEWQAGFLDRGGRFLDRSAAARALGHSGRLEARAYFAGDARPTLEAGHRESWRVRRARPWPRLGEEAAAAIAGMLRHVLATLGRCAPSRG